MPHSTDETGLYWGSKPRGMTVGVRDLAFVGTAVAGIAAAFVSRRKACQMESRNAALLQNLEERHGFIISLEAEQARILSQLNEAHDEAGNSSAECSSLEAQLKAVEGQLESKTQAYELTVQRITAEKEQAISELQVADFDIQ